MVLVDEYEDNHDSAKDWDSNFDQFVQIKVLLFLEIEHRNEVELQSQYLHRFLEFLPWVIDIHVMITIVTSTATIYDHTFIYVFWYYTLYFTGFFYFLNQGIGSIKARCIAKTDA